MLSSQDAVRSSPLQGSLSSNLPTCFVKLANIPPLNDQTESTFICPKCKTKFKSEKTLIQHFRRFRDSCYRNEKENDLESSGTVWFVPPKYKCNLCETFLSSAKALKKHLSRNSCSNIKYTRFPQQPPV